MSDSSSISDNEIQSDDGDGNDDNEVVAAKNADAVETPAWKRRRKNDTVTAADTPTSATSAPKAIQISSSDEEDETPMKTPVQCVHSRLYDTKYRVKSFFACDPIARCIFFCAVPICTHYSLVSLHI